ncbi:Mannosyl-oligosaccharide glucosidase GCS1 [Geodia barretti]|uniref:mannosyl-oligosaccharide glucosidase n=1 Tax=Geodia barretti TaxID=519541 RepID=A0AA35XBD1_GEOBA|nr:Mannosyl-oligosaccharide glucosidase GCS1 [Geodia barretti]
METGLFSTVMSVSGERLSSALEKKEKNFDLRFEDTFHLKEKGFNESEIDCARAAFSNLIGGISYFFGQSKVISRDLDEPVDYWPAELYTGVPSRSFFPRGFLWDEGFHQLLVAHWDTSITKATSSSHFPIPSPPLTLYSVVFHNGHWFPLQL